MKKFYTMCATALMTLNVQADSGAALMIINNSNMSTSVAKRQSDKDCMVRLDTKGGIFYINTAYITDIELKKNRFLGFKTGGKSIFVHTSISHGKIDAGNHPEEKFNEVKAQVANCKPK